ncbi:hypothetical protein MD484_g6805, partial [Candolleomyces efflorescens]
MSIERIPYRGLRRKLVLAFDVGTTFSGVSYCVLDPGSVPEIKGVTRFPAHEQVSGASKIPTVIYYDKYGKVQAVGAEALQEGVFEQAEENDWTKAEWFKLHIRPKDGSTADITSKIPPLPVGKTVVQVVADYLKYLFDCAASYIKDTHANGQDLWLSVQNDIDFVLSHPNGWEGFQQTQIRQAVVSAGLVPDTTAGHGRVSFISEGHFYGSIFVSIHARLFLQDLLKDSDYSEDLDHIVRCFDKTTKIRFSDDKQTQYIKFGSTRDKDEEVGIRFGQLKLNGSDVAGFFSPSIKSVISTVEEMLRMGTHHITHVVLVGGFGASDWLFKQLQTELGSQGLKVVRPELYVNKAVSDGAVAFHLSSMVQARIAKHSYGTLQNVEYDPVDPEHIARFSKLLVRASGRKLVPCGFAAMLAKGTRVSDDNEVRINLWREVDSKDQLASVAFDVHCYTGDIDPCPKFYDMDPNGFKKLCSIEVDLSHLPLEPEERKNGPGVFYTVKYWVVLKFNSAELKAQMQWYENGIERRSPARLVFYQDS